MPSAQHSHRFNSITQQMQKNLGDAGLPEILRSLCAGSIDYACKRSMTLFDDQRQVLKVQKATEIAFSSAFLFLPISKPLLYLSLSVAFLLFIVSGDFLRAAKNCRSLPWIAPAIILSLLPIASFLIHAKVGTQTPHLQLSYYWIFAFVTFLAANRMRITPWLHAFLVGVFMLFFYTQLAANGLWSVPHAPSGAANYILYSQFLAIAIVLLSVLFRHTDQVARKAIYLSGIALFFFGLTQGHGRTGLLTVVILLPYILRNILGPRKLITNLAVVGAVCIVLLQSPIVQNRLKDAAQDVALFQQNITQTSLGYRFEMWETAWNVFRAHPLFGAGPSGFRNAWAGKAEEDVANTFREPHNAFLFYASSFGMVGLIALVWLYMAMLLTGWRERHSLEGGVVFAFAVVCVLSSVTNTVFLGAVSLAWVMLFVGLQGGLAHAIPVSAPCRECNDNS